MIAVAERLGATNLRILFTATTTDIAMIDHGHFRAVRPAHCAAFELLPAL